jgi:hypothetical protein
MDYCYPNNYMGTGINPYYQQPQYMMRGMQPVPCPFVPAQDYRSIDFLDIPDLPDSWSFGPLKVEWNFDGESINLIFKIFEDAVKEILLTLSKPSLSFTATLGEATLNMKVNADFIKNQISISGAVCVDTTCTTFNNTVIASW